MACPHRYRTQDRSRKPRHEPPVELVCFDMDGVLTPGLSSWVRVHEHFGVSNEAALHAFINGEIDDHEFIRRDVALWKQNGPVHIQDIERILRNPPIMDGARPLVDALHEAGIATAIVSGGLEPMAREVGRILGIDTIVANGLETDDEGHLTGEGRIGTPLVNKGAPVLRIMKEQNVHPHRVASIGDSCPDAAMFEVTGLGIAFNPNDPCIQEAADHVETGMDLTALIPHLTRDPLVEKPERR